MTISFGPPPVPAWSHSADWLAVGSVWRREIPPFASSATAAALLGPRALDGGPITHSLDIRLFRQSQISIAQGPLDPRRELRRRRPRPTARRFRRSILQVGRFTPACSAVSRCCCRPDPGSSGRRANASGSCARGPEGPVHSSQSETAPKVGPLAHQDKPPLQPADRA